MKNYILRAFALALCLPNLFYSNASDFVVDGIDYNILSAQDKTVYVTWASKPYTGDIVIPEKITGNGVEYTVTCIGDFAFMQEKITSIVLPNTLTRLGNGSFAFVTGITDVKIPEKVRYIGQACFTNCSNLSKITLPAEIDTLGTGVFAYTSIASASIPKGITALPDQLFEGCTKLAECDIPEGIKSFGFQAFQNNSSLKSITLPSSLESIGKNCFSFAGLTSLHLPAPFKEYGDNAITNLSSLKEYTVDPANNYFVAKDGVLYSKDMKTLNSYPLACGNETYTVDENTDSIADFAFYGNNLKSIVLPENLKTIGKSAFCCSYQIEKLIVPDKVENIGPYGFSTCQNLKEITFGSSLKSFGASANSNNKSLVKVISKNDVPPTGAVFTAEAYANAQLTVPVAAKDAYISAEGWKDFKNISTGDFGYVSDIADDNIDIYTIGNEIVVECPDHTPVQIFTISGKCIYRGIGQSKVSVDNGSIYIIRAGKENVKIAVK